MKKILCVVMFIVVCFCGASAWVAINATNFPDTTFREYVTKNFDKNSNNVLEYSEINSVDWIQTNAPNLKGIEFFTALTTLVCNGKRLTELDVSRNTALTWLDCRNNQLKTLDVSKNTALTYLYCSSNVLTELDVSKNTSLLTLECADNELISIDVSHNTALTYFNCSYNKELSYIDLRHNSALQDLHLGYTSITNVDLSNNTLLTDLRCFDNPIVKLDLSNLSVLKVLQCSDCRLVALKLHPNAPLNKSESSVSDQKPSAKVTNVGGSYPYCLDFASMMGQEYISGIDTSTLKSTKNGSAVNFTHNGQYIYLAALPDEISYIYNTGNNKLTLPVKITVTGAESTIPAGSGTKLYVTGSRIIPTPNSSNTFPALSGKITRLRLPEML